MSSWYFEWYKIENKKQMFTLLYFFNCNSIPYNLLYSHD